jgi:hypothetical protein
MARRLAARWHRMARAGMSGTVVRWDALIKADENECFPR